MAIINSLGALSVYEGPSPDWTNSYTFRFNKASVGQPFWAALVGTKYDGVVFVSIGQYVYRLNISEGESKIMIFPNIHLNNLPTTNNIVRVTSSTGYLMFNGFGQVNPTFPLPRPYGEISSNATSCAKNVIVDNWGSLKWYDLTGMFNAIDGVTTNSSAGIPDLSEATSMKYMFIRSKNISGNINDWNVSNITDISYAFSETSTTWTSSFNLPLNNWNTANVTNMEGTFSYSYAFNQPLNNWNTANVTNMKGMFQTCNSFNQPLNSWNTAKVTDMSSMFVSAAAFNQPLNSWNTSSVTDMSYMFNYSKINTPLNNWNTANVINMNYMFSVTPFNQDISNWNVTKVGPNHIDFDFATPSAWTSNKKPQWIA